MTGASDVMEALAPILGAPPSDAGSLEAPPPDRIDSEPAEDDRAKVIEALGPTPVEIDEIIRFTAIPTRIVQVILLELDLAGRIERHPGQRVSLR